MTRRDSVLITMCCLLLSVSAQAVQEPQALAPGIPVEREIAGGQSHTYQLTLAAGQYLHVVVDQRGIDVVVRLFGPDGKQITEVDSPNGTQGPELVYWVTDVGGSYRLAIQSLEKEAKPGRYEVKLAELRPATPQDRSRLAAQKSYAEGELLYAQGDSQSRHQAIEKYQESLRHWRATGDHQSEAQTLNKMGVLYLSLGESQRALDYFLLALPRAVGDRQSEGQTLNNIGTVYLSLGEMQKALGYYQQALPLLHAVENREGEGITLHNMGAIYSSLGEQQKAIHYYQQALPLLRAVENRQGEAITLLGIGTAFSSLNEKQKALEYYQQALPLQRAVKDRRGEGRTLTSIGSVYDFLGEKPKALDYYNQALALQRVTGDRVGEAITLTNIGSVYDFLGEKPKALDYYNQALALRRVVGDRAGEASTLFSLAKSQRESGNLSEACGNIEEALSLIEFIRINVGSQELRASYFATVGNYYDFYTDLLMQLHRQDQTKGYNAAALQVSERARARSLLEMLSESRVDIRQGVEPALLAREHALQQQLNAKAANRTTLLNGKHTEAQAAAAAKEMADLTSQYQEVEAQIRATSPRYAALTQPQPRSVSEIQQQVLDQDTMLLEYALGPEHSYLWAVTPNSVTSYQLPPRAEIETAVRRVVELLTARQPRPRETEVQHQARIREADANYPAQASALSHILLDPVAGQLRGVKRLLIVAPGALEYLPFNTLSVLQKQTTRNQGTLELLVEVPLMVEHEIIHLPSASMLAVLRHELVGRQPAPKAVAVLADPVFSPEDGRVKLVGKSGASNQIPPPAPSLLSSAVAANLRDVRGGLRRLLMTRDEAEAILSVAPRQAGLKALDFQASRTTVNSAELSQYRIVHFATHGLLDSEHPELSGLILSLVDEAGQPQDGFLRLHQIYNLRLPAELVVLSACQTGLGKEIKGEGLIGLTRGFMYAGAARVVASLWQVNDGATAELMKRFYRGMLREGLSPAAALRAAQIEMWKSRQWQAPFYWGAFVLQGEWK